MSLRLTADAPVRPWREPITRSRDRLVTGVAGGYAERWSVEPTVVRAALGLLTLVGGLGLLIYGLGIVTSENPEPGAPLTSAPPSRLATPPTGRRRELAIGTGTLAVLVLARTVGLWPGDGVMVPATLVAIAVAVIWTSTDGDEERRWTALVTGPVGRITIGVVLAATGVIALAERTGGLEDAGRSASAIAIAVGGIAVIAAPALGRLLGRLDEERLLRVREEERAALAAHLHDSVLQSLVLIQRSDDPRQTVGLARRQERELRSWLYGGRPLGETSTLQAAVESLSAEIEVDHTVRVDAVIVGDQPLDDRASALLGALREAVTNAARHAGVAQIDVYVEVEDDELVAFVRDTGSGFDTVAIAPDRRGVTESIVGRTGRAGGKATVASRLGAGTEVEIRVPRSLHRDQP